MTVETLRYNLPSVYRAAYFSIVNSQLSIE